MTITIEETRDEYTATAGQTIFNYTFKIFENTDLNVYQTPSGSVSEDSTDLITGYSVSGEGDEDGGSITLDTGAAVGDLITIVSAIPESRRTNYKNSGDFKPDVVNADFDRAVSLAKQAIAIANRGLLLQESQQGSKPFLLPEPIAGKVLRWNEALDGMENITLGSADVIINIPVLLLSDYADAAAAITDIGATKVELWLDQYEILQVHTTFNVNTTLRVITVPAFSDDDNDANLTVNGPIIVAPGLNPFDWGNGSGTLTINSTTTIGAVTASNTPLKLRMSTLLIQNGTTADSLKCTLIPQAFSALEGDTIAETDDIVETAITGDFLLNTGGTAMHILATGLAADCLAVLSVGLSDDTALDLTFNVLAFTDGAIFISAFQSGAQASSEDLRALVDIGDITIIFTYLTAG